jgi:glycosyltransferase involved in cell wall biosynthesis
LVNVNYGPLQRTPSVAHHAKLRLAQAADSLTAQFVTRFHSLTDAVADEMSSRLLIPRDRIVSIPRGRNDQALGRRTAERRDRVRRSLDLQDEPLILAAARHERQKGLDVMLHALPRVLDDHPTAKVLIGGRGGHQTAQLQQVLHDEGLEGRVQLIGHRTDVSDLLCAADVFCVPSRWEGFGSILVEALALEVPTVTTAVPAILEVAGNPPCFAIVPPDDPAKLAAAITETLSGDAAVIDKTTRGRIRFEQHYTSEAVAGDMLEFFEGAITAPARQRHT